NVTLASAVTTDAQGRTVVILTFSGSQTDSASALNGGIPSLADGRYQLTIFGSAVIGADGLALDGDGDGTPGGNYVSPPDTAAGGPGQLHLYRLFGDANGDGSVSQIDFGFLRASFGLPPGSPGYLSYLDANNDGVVDLLDF